MTNLGKTAFFEKVAEKVKGAKHDVTAQTVHLVLETFLGELSEAMSRGDSVTITRFGKFGVVEKGARSCRNIQTGEMTEVPAHKIVKFWPGSELKESVR